MFEHEKYFKSPDMFLLRKKRQTADNPLKFDVFDFLFQFNTHQFIISLILLLFTRIYFALFQSLHLIITNYKSI